MGLTKDFFTKPISVPITLSKTTVNKDGSISKTEETALFSLRREKQTEADAIASEVILNTRNHSEIRLARFCNLLTEEPKGFDDFPTDGRALVVRANEYFEGEGFEGLVKAVMVFYDREVLPLEFFRGI